MEVENCPVVSMSYEAVATKPCRPKKYFEISAPRRNWTF